MQIRVVSDDDWNGPLIPNLFPVDYGWEFGIERERWHELIVSSLNLRPGYVDKLISAVEEVAREALPDKGEGLRHPLRLFCIPPIFDVTDYVLLFLYKEDNNGNTLKIYCGEDMALGMLCGSWPTSISVMRKLPSVNSSEACPEWDY